MSQASNLPADSEDTHFLSTVDSFRCTVRSTDTPDRFKQLHDEVSTELAARSSAPGLGAHADKHFSGATTGELQGMLEELWDRAMFVLSKAQVTADELR